MDQHGLTAPPGPAGQAGQVGQAGQAGLFTGINAFADLEARILALPDPRDRQTAFELFAEGWLATQRLVWARDIRFDPGPDWPDPAPTGVVETPWGDAIAFVCLFVDSRRPLSKKDLPFFFAPPGAFAGRLLFTNATQPPTTFNACQDGWRITGGDLDHLGPEAFAALRIWLMGGGLPPRPERREAVWRESLVRRGLEALGARDAVTLVSPGGAGRAHLLRRLAQSAGSQAAVVIATSDIARIAELLELLQSQAPWSTLSAIVHCPDPPPTRKYDLPDLRPARRAFGLVNDPDALRVFWSWRFPGARLILTTHRALPGLRKILSGLPPGELLLRDEPEPATRRDPLPDPLARHSLLLAPAPKRRDGARRNAAGEAPVLWDLTQAPFPDTLVQTETLQKAEAVRELARIRVLLCAVSDRNDRWPAALRAMAASRARRILTFHPTAEEAHAFAAQAPPGFSSVQSLDGTATDEQRQTILDRFDCAAGPALLASARALSAPGVLPPCDLAFLFGAGSKEDWSTTAALLGRLLEGGGSPVVLGLLLPPAEPKEGSSNPPGAPDALKPALQALFDLHPDLRAALRSARRRLGAGLGLDMVSLSRWFGFTGPPLMAAGGPPVLLTAIVNHLTAPWEEWVGRLAGFIEANGRLEPNKTGPSPAELAAWIRAQRTARAKGNLSKRRIAVLDRLGFVWDPEARQWALDLQSYAAFRERHGHGVVPEPCPDDPLLGDWAARQRRLERSGRLDPERRQELERLGFVFDLDRLHWERMFERFQRHVWRWGEADPPDPWPEEPELAAWVKKSRQEWAAGKLAPERIARLERLGFVWDPEAKQWESMRQRLVRFTAEAGHGAVAEKQPTDPELADWAQQQRKMRARRKLAPEREALLTELGFVWDLDAYRWDGWWAMLARSLPRAGPFPDHWPGQAPLADWIHQQRRLRRSNRLSPERIQRLDQLGFVWDPEARAWEASCDALAKQAERLGHPHLPRDWEEPPGLGRWLNEQRRKWRLGKLPPERVERLEALGVIQDVEAADWERCFLMLSRFRTQKNHCLVPENYPANPELGRWVKLQRQAWRREAIDPQRIERMEGLGFVWDTREVFWEEMFAALMDFREIHGHCNVPDPWEENPDLSWWVQAQRKTSQNGNLNEEWRGRLDAVGFIWDPQEAVWREMYQALVGFQARFGHCLVSEGWPEAPKLAAWAIIQRNARGKNLLGAERVALLDRLGFIWDPRQVVVEQMFLALAAFRQRHGHGNVPLEWPENPQLGLWVLSQRQQVKAGRLDPARVRRLMALGVAF